MKSRSKQAIIEHAQRLLDQYSGLKVTVRQLYYRFRETDLMDHWAIGVNGSNRYKQLDRILVEARELGLIPDNRFADQIRLVMQRSQWDNLEDFMDTVKTSYRRHLLQDQDRHVEVWVEKKALAGVIEPIANRYGVTLLAGSGYSSRVVLNDLPTRAGGKPITILYLGDLDPSGWDISRHLEDKISAYDTVERIAINPKDVEEFNLPIEFLEQGKNKARQTFNSRFKVEVGFDGKVELDALPPDTLAKRITESIEEHLDMGKFDRQLKLEETNQEKLGEMIETLSN